MTAGDSKAHILRRARDLRERGLRLIEQADMMLARIDASEQDVELGLADAGLLLSGEAHSLTIAADAAHSARSWRNRYFPDRLFGEPAWDILLDLFIQQQRGNPVSISSACTAGGTAPTTGLRWLNTLEAAGLLEREADRDDGRMSWIRLTTEAHDRMTAYLQDIVSQAADWRADRQREPEDDMALAAE